MEGLMNKMNRTGSTLYSDTSLRLPSKPRIVSKGKLVDDFGTSGFISKAARSRSTSSSLSNKEKKRVRRDRSSPEAPHISGEGGEKEESDDEIDLLSSPRRGSDDDMKCVSRPNTVLYNGREHAYHPNYKPNDALKNLKFTKKKDKAPSFPTPQKENSSSLTTKSRSPSVCVLEPKSPNMSTSRIPSTSKPPPKPARSSMYQPQVPSGPSLSQPDNKPATKFKPSTNALQKRGSKVNPFQINDESSADEHRPTLQRCGSRMNPVRVDESSADERRGILQKHGSKVNPVRVDESSADERRSSASSSRKPHQPASFPSLSPLPDDVKGKQKENSFVPAAFPMSPPTKSPANPYPDTSPLTPIDQLKSKKSQTYSTFPDMSPLSPTPKPMKAASSFPVSPLQSLTPLPSLQHRKQRAAKGRPRKSEKLCLNESEADDEEATDVGRKKGKLRPFPMEAEIMASSEDISRVSSGNGKRSSSSPAPGSPKKKRAKADDLPPPSSSLPVDEDGDDDDFFYNPSIDANTLCPYCDEPLPESPTPLLRQLLANTAKKSKRSPRPTNPMGRRAPVGVFIAVCQRHRFESKILPEAEEKGWPKSIEWDKLEGRVRKMKVELEALVKNSEIAEEADFASDEDEDDDWHIGRGKPKLNCARDRCASWQEAMKEVKEKGTKAAADVKNQFANFEKTQPGYYGELGSIIIHQSLYELFPPTSIDPVLVAPLSPKEFIERVLIPEVAVRLIMEDRSLFGPSGTRKALQVLRESTSYGVAMFPEDTGEHGDPENGVGRKGRGKRKASGKADDLTLSVADTMVREKARRRRQELEEEDKLEGMRGQDTGNELSGSSVSARRKGKGKRGEKAPISNSNEGDPKTLASERPRPKPKPKLISKPASTNDEDGDTAMAQDGQNDFTITDLDLGDMGFEGMDELDAMMDDYTNGMDASLASSTTAPPPPNSSTRGDDTTVDSYSEAMSISSDSDAISVSSIASKSRGRRKGKAKKISVDVDERVPSVEFRSKAPPSSRITDVDATLKSSNTTAVSSSSSGNYDESLTPLERARLRMQQRRTSEADKRSSITNRKDGEQSRGRQSKYGLQKATSMCSTASSADWLLDDDSD